jgi:hypothetical protein
MATLAKIAIGAIHCIWFVKADAVIRVVTGEVARDPLFQPDIRGLRPVGVRLALCVGDRTADIAVIRIPMNVMTLFAVEDHEGYAPRGSGPEIKGVALPIFVWCSASGAVQGSRLPNVIVRICTQDVGSKGLPIVATETEVVDPGLP